MSNNHPNHVIYVPGYVPQKFLMLAIGVLILVAGLTELVPNLTLMATGTWTEARAVEVVKTKTGLPDKVLASDREIDAALEPTDRSYLFWNVFNVELTGGETAPVRLPTAAISKPIFPIIDSEGMPTILRVVYSGPRAERIVFPTVMDTWVFPALTALIGALTVGGATLLLVNARKGIEMPIVHGGGSEQTSV